MFNDLNEGQGNSPEKVDDIFAETEGSLENSSNLNKEQIETRKVGLGSSDSSLKNDTNIDKISYDEPEEGSGSSKWLKIAIISVAVIIFLLGAYLVYSKFIAPGDNEVDNNLNQDPIENNVENNTEDDLVVIEDDEEDDDFVDPISDVEDPIVNDNEDDEVDLQNTDSDNDGLFDYDEIYMHGTDPNNPDSDGDGLTDYEEVVDYKTNPLKADSDNDGLTDYEEVVEYNTNPLNSDTDGDSYLDGAEVEAGYDPLTKPGSEPSEEELKSMDSDDDGLSDYDEINIYKTDPNNPDTDGDGYSDGEEVNNGYNPNGDGLLE